MTEDTKEYIGVIWVDGQPGQRFRILAISGEEAERKLKEQFGEGHVYTLYNEADAERPR